MPQALENHHRCGYTPHPLHMSVQQLNGVQPGRVNLSAERRSSCCLALLNGPLPLCPNKHFFASSFLSLKWEAGAALDQHTITQRVPMFLFCRSLLTECRALKMKTTGFTFHMLLHKNETAWNDFAGLAWNPSGADVFHISKTSRVFLSLQ